MKTHPFDFEQGAIILVNKPLTWTSFDVVKKVRNLTGQKIGHAGTLDPLAEGLLILSTGKKTKQIQFLQDQGKVYEGSFILGAERASHDKETEIDKTYEYDGITEEMLEKTAATFLGVIHQIPPQHSAVKIGGKRAYKAARKGETLALRPREVTIDTFEITSINMPRVSFRIACSKGTYIRSIVRDFGKKLDNGAYLDHLVRTKIGDYKLEDAYSLDDLASLF